MKKISHSKPSKNVTSDQIIDISLVNDLFIVFVKISFVHSCEHELRQGSKKEKRKENHWKCVVH